MKNLLFLLLLLPVFVRVLAQPAPVAAFDSATGPALHQLLRQTVDNRRVFGASFQVMAGDGKVLWAAAEGNLKPETPYFIASTTKLCVTAVILHLRAQGKLSLDDAAASFLPPGLMQGIHVFKGVDYSEKLTIRQLLAHTSGLPDYFQGKPKGGQSLEKTLTSGHDRAWSLAEMLEIVRSMKPAFAPDTPGKALYSDTNFQLLGAVIESITGKPVAEVFQTLLFEPLGLKQTYLYTNPADQTPLALRYGAAPLHIPLAMTSFRADGGVVSTAAEMAVFLHAYMTGRYFPQAALAEIQQQWNPIFFPMDYWFQMPGYMTAGKPMPALIGHTGLSGAFAWYCPEWDLYFTGTVNQIHPPGISFRMMVKAMVLLRDGARK